MSMILIGRRLTPDEWRRLGADPSVARELLEDEQLDLDKAWHGIHFLLAGRAWDTVDGAGEAVLGGEPIGDDVGYGPARVLAPARVRVVAEGLRAVDLDALRSRYDASAFTSADIYPQIWDEPDVFDEYLAPAFTDLKAFYLGAAKADEAVLLAMT